MKYKRKSKAQFTKQELKTGQVVYRNSLGHFVSKSLLNQLNKRAVKIG